MNILAAPIPPCPKCGAVVSQMTLATIYYGCGRVEYPGYKDVDPEESVICLTRQLAAANLRTRELVSAIQDLTRRIGVARRPQSIRVELQAIVDTQERWGYDS